MSDMKKEIAELNELRMKMLNESNSEKHLDKWQLEGYVFRMLEIINEQQALIKKQRLALQACKIEANYIEDDNICEPKQNIIDTVNSALQQGEK